MNTIPFFKKFKVDLILGGATFVNLLPLMVILSQKYKKKLVAITHGSDYLTRAPFFFKTSYFQLIEKIVVTSKRNKFFVKNIHKLPDTKLKVIPLGLILKDYEVKESKEELRKKWRISPTDFVIICVGRHEPRKKFDLVISSISKIKKRNPDINIRCIFIGFGIETSSLKSLANKLEVVEDVKFLGECSTRKRNEFYKLSDLFIMPSVTLKNSIEGFGIVFLEANYYNLPIIGASSGGVIEAIKHGQNGLLVKPNDIEDLIDKILYLYSNEGLRIKMGLTGHERVIKFFNWEYILDSYIQLFQSL